MENSYTETSSFLLGKGPLSQIVIAFILSVALYIALLSLEAIYVSYKQVSRTHTEIEDKTLSSTIPVIYSVNPKNIGTPNYRNLVHSQNEKTGIEYSYSCFLLLNQDNFTPNNISAYKHIFHRGYDTGFPLLGPGLFVNAGTNTLRLYQNNTLTWYNYIDINDIPITKWFHLVILAKNNATEIYVNGNLSAKLTNNNAVLYQNYQPLYLFENLTVTSKTNANTPSIPNGETFNVIGNASGLISRFHYYSYALSFTEIQDLMNMGPNPQMVTNNLDKPPYFIDNWWTGRNMLM
jgi:hypothetical protein